MFGEFIYITFFVGLTVVMLNNLYSLGLFNWREVKQISQQKNQPRRKGQSRQQRTRPAVDIFIYTQNNQDIVLKTLHSVLKQSYQKFNVVIVDNDLSYQILSEVGQVILRYPKRSIHVAATNKPSTRSDAVSQAIKRYSKGDWLLIINAGQLLNKDTLHNANRYFIDNPEKNTLIPNVHIRHKETIVGLLQKTTYHLRFLAKKALRRKCLMTDEAAFLTNKKYLKKNKNIGFNENVTLLEEPLNYKAWLRRSTQASWSNQLIKFLQPLIIGYLLFVAIVYGTYDYILLASLVFCVVLAMNILFDRSLGARAKATSIFWGLPLYLTLVLDNLAQSLVSASRLFLGVLQKSHLRR